MRPSRPRFRPGLVALEDRAVPATFTVNPGSGDGNTIFNDVATAIAKANATPGLDTINLVANAAIPVGANHTVITDSVNFVGVSKTASVIVATSSTPGIASTDATFQASTGAVVNWTNVGFTGTGFKIGVAFAYTNGAAGTFTNTAVQNVTSDGVGLAILGKSAGSLNVVNSSVTEFDRSGIQFQSTNGSVTGSTITGLGKTNTVSNGIEVFDASNVTISGNTISGNTGTQGGFFSAGIVVDGSAGPSPVVTIFGNTISNNQTGILFGDTANDQSQGTVQYNNIVGNPSGGMVGNGANTIQATANFWGSAAGPGAGGNNAALGAVNASPFIQAGPVPTASASSIAAYVAANSTATSTAVPNVFATSNEASQTITLTATVTGATVGTVTFTVRDAAGNVLGTSVAGVVNGAGVATAAFTLPGRTRAVDYTITAVYTSGVELLLGSSGTGVLSLSPFQFYAAGAGRNGPGVANAYNPDSSVRFGVSLFGSAGIRTATADVTGDGVADLIVGSGPGGPPIVIVFDGVTQAEVVQILAFESSFTGGVYVAGGDFNGDGFAEIVVTPDEGGGPVVAVYSGVDAAAGSIVELTRFLGIQDSGFRGGARAAVGDYNGDGVPDLAVSAGFQGGPRITLWNGQAVLAGQTTAGDTPDANFFAFEATLRNGCFVAIGDVTGDGLADLIFGGGPGGGPRVRIADAAQVLAAGNFGTLDNILGAVVANFFAGSDALRGGGRVAAHDLDGDGLSELITGSGDATLSEVRIYDSAAILSSPSSPSPETVFDPFGAVIPGGVFVG